MHNAKYTAKKKVSCTKTQFQVKILNKQKIKDRVTQQVRDKSARIPACNIDFSNKFLPQFFHLSHICKILKESIIIKN